MLGISSTLNVVQTLKTMFKGNGTDQPFSFHIWENFLELLPSRLYLSCCCCSVSMSDSSWSHAQQHDRLPCPLPSPGACSNSCLLNQWCHPGFPGHPTISSSVASFSSCPQSFPVSGSFPMSWLFASAGQSIGASASVLPVNIQDWFPLRLTGWISLLFRGLSRVFNTTVWKHQFYIAQPSLWFSSHTWTRLLGKQ